MQQEERTCRALMDKLFEPVSGLVDFSREQVKNSQAHRSSVRLTVTERVEHSLGAWRFSAARQYPGEQPARQRVQRAQGMGPLCPRQCLRSHFMRPVFHRQHRHCPARMFVELNGFLELTNG